MPGKKESSTKSGKKRTLSPALQMRAEATKKAWAEFKALDINVRVGDTRLTRRINEIVEEMKASSKKK